LRLVGIAADSATVRNLRDFPTPCAYVLLAQEQFQDNAPGHGERGSQVALTQKGLVKFGVVLAGRNYREQAGGQLAGEIVDLIHITRSCLQGWVPDVPGARPLQVERGDLLQYDDAVALWCDVWKTQTIIGREAR
jgi:hypothetical protein